MKYIYDHPSPSIYEKVMALNPNNIFFFKNKIKEGKYLHDAFGIPKNGIGMKICSWIKPKKELLLSLSLSLAEDVCM